MTATATAIRPASPVFHGVEESDNKRWYLIGDDRLISTTTVTGMADKPALMMWAINQTVAAVWQELPAVVAASRTADCGNAGSRCMEYDGHDFDTCTTCPCLNCRTCMSKWLARQHKATADRRSDEGTRVHDVAEWWTYTGEIKPHDADIAPYVKAFRQFIADYGLTPDSFIVAEALVVNREHGYAGTTDGIVVINAAATDKAAKLVARVTGVPAKKAAKLGLSVAVIIDWKTRENTGPLFHPPQALQLAAYRHAPVLRIKGSDHEEPMLHTDAAMLIQLRPDGYTARLTVSTEDTFRRGFLNLLGFAYWLVEDGPASVSSHSFVLPETLAARARKAAKEQAAAADTAADGSVPAHVTAA